MISPIISTICRAVSAWASAALYTCPEATSFSRAKTTVWAMFSRYPREKRDRPPLATGILFRPSNTCFTVYHSLGVVSLGPYRAGHRKMVTPKSPRSCASKTAFSISTLS